VDAQRLASHGDSQYEDIVIRIAEQPVVRLGHARRDHAAR
jgi:hypothetical protein